jgi:hypothetical protein
MISLSQTSYIDTIIKRLQLDNAYPIHMPVDPNVVWSKDMCPTTDEGRRQMASIPYMVAVGSLMYAAMDT